MRINPNLPWGFEAFIRMILSKKCATLASGRRLIPTPNRIKFDLRHEGHSRQKFGIPRYAQTHEEDQPDREYRTRPSEAISSTTGRS